MRGRFTEYLSWEELRRLADLIGQPRKRQGTPRYIHGRGVHVLARCLDFYIYET